MTTQRVSFRGHVLDLPADWLVEQGASNVVATPPDDDGPFVQNLVVQVVGTDTDPAAALSQVDGSVVLSRARSAGRLPAEEIVFGYPLPVAAVTAVQLVGDPATGGRLLATYSSDATHFVDHWPVAQDVLQSIRRVS